METKKTEKANINKKKASFLMLGLVCATSLTLMSFEYRNFDVSRSLYADASDDIIVDIITFEVIEVLKSKPKVVTLAPENKEFIEVSKDPVIVEVLKPIDNKIVKNPVIIDLKDMGDYDIGDPDDETDIEILIDEPFTVVEDMPEFPGGIKAMYAFLSNEVHYPEISREMESQGTAYVQFIIEMDGSVSGVTVLKGVDKYIDKESKRVVKNMPKWTPGKQRGKNVRVFFTLPIKYRMD